MWRLLQVVVAHLLLMCVTVVENVEFLNTLKVKAMHEADFTATQIQEFEKVWERTLINWKDSVILSVVSKAPPYFRTTMPFEDWSGAMKFLKSSTEGKDT